ncbi:hypothetical protein [Streptomyces hydrogenans]|uniref:hypothetical protein n=1 Tax=Streptomyces hydrogenans TaxID=1873719 RepID=UPI0036E03F1B
MRIAHVRLSAHSTPTTTSTEFNANEALRLTRLADTTVSRPARRTFAEMLPGATRQPVLQLAPNVHFLPTGTVTANNERCLFCDGWLCDGVSCQQFAPVPAGARVAVMVAA